MTVRRHVDAESLAAFREDLLPRRKARRIAAHLSGCARCGNLDARLADVTSVLASAPAPPMPAALTARIEAALAAEAAAMAVGAAQDAGADATLAAGDGRADTPARPGAAGPVTPGAIAPSAVTPGRSTPERSIADPDTPGPVTPGRSTRGPFTPAGSTPGRTPGATAPGPGGPGRPRRARAPRRRSGYGSRLALRVAAAAAAVVIVAGGGFALLRLVGATERPASTAASSGAGHPALSAPHPAASPGRFSAPTGKTFGLPVITSGTNYQPGRLASQVSAVIAAAGRQPLRRLSPTVPRAEPAFGVIVRNLPACVARVTGGRKPQLVDLARYRGRPAVVIVVPASGRTLHVWVVAPNCSGTTGDVLAQLTLPSRG